jgi:hypothetical protein
VIDELPLVHESKVYFGSEDGNLYALDIKTGKEVWRFKTGGLIATSAVLWKDFVFFGSWDCHLYKVNIHTHEEVWRFSTSSSTPAYIPPAYDVFKLEVKRETRIEEPVSEGKYKKKKEETVSLSDYKIESEYSTTSEYKQKSDYDVNFVIFEGVLEGEELWTSDSKVLSPDSRISM